MKKINKYCVVLCMCERRDQTNENSSLALTVKFALPLVCECSLHMFECECISVCAKYMYNMYDSKTKNMSNGSLEQAEPVAPLISLTAMSEAAMSAK